MVVSVVVVNSRGDKHPDWVFTCIESIRQQYAAVDLVVIDNIGRLKTIGRCFNEGVKESIGDYVLFVGDDDYISRDYVWSLQRTAENNCGAVCYTTYMTTFNDKTGQFFPHQQTCTGMWKRDYLLKYPFNETLKSGIDREYYEETVKRGDTIAVNMYHYGYFYRKHEDYSSAGEITFTKEPKDVYVLAGLPHFFIPIARKLKEKYSLFLSRHMFEPKLADGAKIIWCEFANANALRVHDYDCTARKFLRIHAYEVFNDSMFYYDWSRFEKIVFVADHIKEYLEKRIGKIIPNAVVIPNGVELDKFTLDPNKEWNNKIGVAGQISNKKGAIMMIWLAREFPDFEFHVAGTFIENDVAHFFQNKKPDNLILEPHNYDINKWYQDKTYILSTSLRESQHMTICEGMACGLKPLIFDWIGAENVYGNNWLYRDKKELAKLLHGDVTPERYRNYIEQRYDWNEMYKKIEKILAL